jgi:hypothetical protein
MQRLNGITIEDLCRKAEQTGATTAGMPAADFTI